MSLLVATPVRAAEPYAAQVSLGYAEFLRALSHQIPFKTVVTFSLDVVRARNRVTGIVLREKEFADVTNVLWLDDDQWTEDLGLVGRMLALNLPVVGAAYTNKKRPVRFVHQPWPGPRKLDEKGCLDVRAVGFGFTITSRACLEEMADDSHWYRDFPNETTCPNLFGQQYDYLEPGPDSASTLLSEDFSFCKLWREGYGGKIALYAGGVILHAGAHAWSARDMQHDLTAGHERVGG